MATTAPARKFAPTANPEMAEAMRGLRRSSAAQPHTLKKYKGARKANMAKAIRDFR